MSDAGPVSLVGSYGVDEGVFDEMKDGEGRVRAGWGYFSDQLERLGVEEVERRWRVGQRMLADNGVTYHVYEDPRGMDRPWALDPIPMIVSAEEWAGIESGLIQRARLLNAVCGDLYGEQKLLKDGSIPAELILGHPNFLRPCHGLRVPRDQHLMFYAADLARSPDGRWWVLNDRTQAPSGAGYAVENRLVVSRTMSGVFGASRVTRLARFFARFRESLRAMSPRVGENPRVVLLTPGPFNETFFEHAYFARYLGFTLAQGDDLTVRDDKVFLKTLGGLRRVDVVLRRLDDSYCDPLELRGDSAIGVPGLVQAAWSGNVVVANALGSGVLETAGLMPFTEGLCRSVLGEEQKLSSVATWWCGQPKELAYVEEHLRRLVIKPSFPGAPAPGLGGVAIDAVFGDALDAAGREEMIGRIRERPEAYVAQESVNISTCPVWAQGGLSPRHVMLRAYVAATDDGYIVMPGGLTRVSSTHDSRVTSMQRGGGSKDTWVLSEGPVSSFSLVRSEGGGRVTMLANDSFDLPSRIADNLYWLGRYLERSEGLVRLLRAIVTRITDEAVEDEGPEVSRLVMALDVLTGQEEASEEPAKRVLEVLQDAEASWGLSDALLRVRRLASLARDRVSVDAWRVLSQLVREYEEAIASGVGTSGDWAEVMDLLNRLLVTLAAFTGVGTESMLRNQGWRFLDMGRRLERAVSVVSLLRLLTVNPEENEGPVFDALLEVMASAMSYRQRYLAVPTALPTIEMLLLDETNPRSCAYQLVELAEHLDQLPRATDAQNRRGEDQLLVLRMLTNLRLADPVRLAGFDNEDARDALAFELMGLSAQLPELSDAITRQFLSHNLVSRRLGQREALAIRSGDVGEPERLGALRERRGERG
ncbi:circularly permuted type 2 ATP-grasp protein [Mucisphaera sp.]|uniref:circularly permuted type 2 ATP-grasp protein n=1 Tax=Mucisphaera sp. TaxID=2913024 RepID=UPI003D152513